MLVTISNFQSIEKISFSIPEKSFTCIVGPSNIGKSAIRRALECALYNKSEASYIRNGASSCSVHIILDDGTDILWTRDKKSSHYKINGETFAKLNKTVPQILVDKGFKEIEISNDKYNVQIASQFDNIFLLNQNGSKVTEVFSNLGNLHRIVSANKMCSSELKEIKSKLNVRREDFQILKEKNKNFRGLDEQINAIDVLKEFLNEIKIKKNKKTLLETLFNKYTVSGKKLKILLPIKKVDISAIDVDITLYTALAKLQSKYLILNSKIEKYAPLRDLVIPLFEVSEEYSNFKKLQKLNDTYTRQHLKLSDYQKLPEIPAPVDIDTSDYLKLKRLEILLKKASDKVTAYKNIPNSDLNISVDTDIIKLNKLRNLLNQALTIKKKIQSDRESIASCEKKLETLERDKKEVEKTLGVCPMCDRSFDV